MKLKKLLILTATIVFISGCSYPVQPIEKTNNDASTTTITVNEKDLTKVKGTMISSTKNTSVLDGTTVEYYKDKAGYVYKINLHKIDVTIPYDMEQMNINGLISYLDNSQIENWKESLYSENNVSREGYSVKLTIEDKLAADTAKNLCGSEIAYKAVYDYNLDITKATKDDINSFTKMFKLKKQDGKILENSLQNALEVYNMEFE